MQGLRDKPKRNIKKKWKCEKNWQFPTFNFKTAVIKACFQIKNSYISTKEMTGISFQKSGKIELPKKRRKKAM